MWRPKRFCQRIFFFPVQCFSTGRGFYFPQNPKNPFRLFSLLSSSSLICSVCWMICRSPSSDIPFRCAWAYIRNARASAQNKSSSRDLILSTVHEVIFSGVRWFIKLTHHPNISSLSCPGVHCPRTRPKVLREANSPTKMSGYSLFRETRRTCPFS